MRNALRVAVQGCCHGELNAVYRAIAQAEQRNKYKVDLLIVGGDFQSIRNLSDLQCMAVPAKYRRLGDFADYYAGKKVAPVLTIFVGGNHEASNYLQELFYGGWVAPNIYYLGAANVIRFGGLRIGGISGIWSKPDYVRGHMESVPYDQKALRSVYHVRQYEVRKLLQMSDPEDRCDLFLSHDWPRGIEQSGDTKQLLQQKPFFKAEVARNDLGSPANEELINALKPRYWLSAHLHVRFEATLSHAKTGEKRSHVPTSPQSEPQSKILVDADQPIAPSTNPDEIAIDLDDDDGVDLQSANPDEIVSANPDEIVLDLDDMDGEPKQVAETDRTEHAAEEDNKGQDSNNKDMSITAEEKQETLEEYKARLLRRIDEAETEATRSTQSPPSRSSSPEPKDDNQTYFLALDKCLPRRQFLEILTVPLAKKEDKDNTKKPKLEYDRKWLAVTRTFAPYLSRSAYQTRLPDAAALEQELKVNEAWVTENVKDTRIPLNFRTTAPVQSEKITERSKVALHKNGQTNTFCDMLQIPRW